MRVRATIPIKALTRKATTGKSQRVMPPAQRAYYTKLYYALCDAGFWSFPVRQKGDKLKDTTLLRFTFLEFHFTDWAGRDWDNLIKAFQDAGQPSKWWTPKSERWLVPDLWADEQFDGTDHARRVLGSDGNYIVVEIATVGEG